MTEQERTRLMSLARQSIGGAYISFPFRGFCDYCGFDLLARYEGKQAVPYMSGCCSCNRSYCE